MRRYSGLAAAAAIVLLVGADHPSPRVADQQVILHTMGGDILLSLYPDVAPRHVEQFLRLVQLGVYDSTHFSRVEPGFLIQLSTAEDRRIPLTAQQRSAIRRIPAEFSAVSHTAGTLSMARQLADPDSAETSFSILLADAPHLDGQFTVFGHVEEGIPVLQEILKVPRTAGHSPVARIHVTRAEVVGPGDPRPSLAPARAFAVDRGLLWRALSVVPSPNGETVPWQWFPETNPILLAGLAAMTLGSLAIYVLAHRLATRFVTAIALLNALVAGFVLFAVLAPLAAARQGLAVLVFVGWLAVIRLMGRFESAA